MRRNIGISISEKIIRKKINFVEKTKNEGEKIHLPNFDCFDENLQKQFSLILK